jgi:hypothetical protein
MILRSTAAVRACLVLALCGGCACTSTTRPDAALDATGSEGPARVDASLDETASEREVDTRPPRDLPAVARVMVHIERDLHPRGCDVWTDRGLDLGCRRAAVELCRNLGFGGAVGVVDLPLVPGPEVSPGKNLWREPATAAVVGCLDREVVEERSFPLSGSCTADRAASVHCESLARRGCVAGSFAASAGVIRSDASTITALCVRSGPRLEVQETTVDVSTLSAAEDAVLRKFWRDACTPASALDGNGCAHHADQRCSAEGAEGRLGTDMQELSADGKVDPCESEGPNLDTLWGDLDEVRYFPELGLFASFYLTPLSGSLCDLTREVDLFLRLSQDGIRWSAPKQLRHLDASYSCGVLRVLGDEQGHAHLNDLLFTIFKLYQPWWGSDSYGYTMELSVQSICHTATQCGKNNTEVQMWNSCTNTWQTRQVCGTKETCRNGNSCCTVEYYIFGGPNGYEDSTHMRKWDSCGNKIVGACPGGMSCANGSC